MQVVNACKASLDRLGVDKMAIYQIHWPSGFNDERYWDGIAKCYDLGLIESVGVSNYGAKKLIKVNEYLKQRNVPLSINQVQYSLLSRNQENNDLLKTAADLNITILAYSPLAQGILTGKFNSNNIPKGPRSALTRATLDKADTLLKSMGDIAKSQSEITGLNVSMSQVAINWCISKGVVPIPGARNIKQAIDNCNSLKWTLTEEEIRMLDDLSKKSGINIPTPLQSK